jgi:hypothetical protein
MSRLTATQSKRPMRLERMRSSGTASLALSSGPHSVSAIGPWISPRLARARASAVIEASAAVTSAARALSCSLLEAPAGGLSCGAAPSWGACRRARRARSALTATAVWRASRSSRLLMTALKISATAATTRTTAATPPPMTAVRLRPRRRGARMSVDLPQREQRSRALRSSKPQWGQVRSGSSVAVGGT